MPHPPPKHHTVLVAYITAHGFGHAGRTCDVLKAWSRRNPERRITVVSSLPDWFLKTRLPEASYRRASFDVGVVQKDAVVMDIETTLARAQELLVKWDELVQSVRAWLRDEQAGIVVSDIPAIPLEAACGLDIPVYALGNFSWDWIYSSFARQDPAWQPIAERFRESYAGGARLLRYPFFGPMPAFQDVQDIPLVASPGKDRREKLAEECGADPARTWLLFCFIELEFTQEGIEHLATLQDYQFFTTGRLNWNSNNAFSLDPQGRNFADLVASVDAVVSKPGFGILSDCAANDKPIVYAEREGFVEYPVLVEAMNRHLRSVHIPLQELYSGRLEPALTKLESLSEPPIRLQVDGAEKVAELLKTDPT